MNDKMALGKDFLLNFGFPISVLPAGISYMCYKHWGQDSSVGIVTRYELDGPGIESRWGRDFSHTSRPALGSTLPPVQWVPGLSRGYKRPGCGVEHPPRSSAEFEKQ
jgi:hypothetical protein